MTIEQMIALGLLVLALGLFAWGKWRYDLVALLVMLIGVAAGVIPAGEAFAGFGHPAVITVAAVLIISRALAESGVVDTIAARLAPAQAPFLVQLGVLCLLTAGLSTVMNNIGALAIVMPIAIAAARRAKRSAAVYLMPLSFCSLLGGMTTLIGTPPNIVVAGYRAKLTGESYGLFDFTPVGGAVALAGIAFIVLIGWRFIPRRDATGTEELFGVKGYITELRPKANGKAVGLTLRELDLALEKHELEPLGLVRGQQEIPAYASWARIGTDTEILVEGPPEGIATAVKELDLELSATEGHEVADLLRKGDNEILEAVVQPYSPLTGMTPEEMQLQSHYFVNLLAVAREGSAQRGRLKGVRFAPGDVLLLQGAPARLNEAVSALGCLPLARRDLPLGNQAKPAVTLGVVGIALAAIGFELAPAAVSLAAAAVALVLLGALRLRRAYEAIEWPVVVLLGAMIPVGAALETSGATRLIASGLASFGQAMSAEVLLVVVMVLTMLITDVINNAATAVMMAPISIGLAQGLDANPDAFLMAVAIGSSCAFLTPIGHQNNTLVMGPGGYRFWDYWQMGVPLDVLILAVGVPMLLIVWPL